MLMAPRFVCGVLLFGLLMVAIDNAALSIVFLVCVAIGYGPRSMFLDVHAPRVESRDAG